MTKALFLLLFLFSGTAGALNESREADGRCNAEVLADTLTLKTTAEETAYLALLVPLELALLPLNERAEAGNRMLAQLRNRYFTAVRLFRNKFGDVDCWIDSRGRRIAFDMKEIYVKLDEYEASLIPAPACDPDFARAFTQAQDLVRDTQGVLKDLLQRMIANGGTLDEKDRALQRQAVDITISHAKRFRETHPQKFRCRVAKDTVADSDIFDRNIPKLEEFARRLP